jgi:hypothetical protein
MKAPHFFITAALATLCLILTITTIVLGKTNNALLQTQQRQQEEINKGNMSVQIGQNILRDLAEISLRNPQIKDLLAKNGYTVNTNPPAGSATPETSNTTPAK